jgi:hypothetical protein
MLGYDLGESRVVMAERMRGRHVLDIFWFSMISWCPGCEVWEKSMNQRRLQGLAWATERSELSRSSELWWSLLNWRVDVELWSKFMLEKELNIVRTNKYWAYPPFACVSLYSFFKVNKNLLKFLIIALAASNICLSFLLQHSRDVLSQVEACKLALFASYNVLITLRQN